MLKVKEMIVLSNSIQLFCTVTFFITGKLNNADNLSHIATISCDHVIYSTQAENHNALNSNSCLNTSPDLYKILPPIIAQVSWCPRSARIFKQLANAKLLILRNSLAYIPNV